MEEQIRIYKNAISMLQRINGKITNLNSSIKTLKQTMRSSIIIDDKTIKENNLNNIESNTNAVINNINNSVIPTLNSKIETLYEKIALEKARELESYCEF